MAQTIYDRCVRADLADQHPRRAAGRSRTSRGRLPVRPPSPCRRLRPRFEAISATTNRSVLPADSPVTPAPHNLPPCPQPHPKTHHASLRPAVTLFLHCNRPAKFDPLPNPQPQIAPTNTKRRLLRPLRPNPRNCAAPPRPIVPLWYSTSQIRTILNTLADRKFESSASL